jgi:spermidine synthase
VTSGGNRPTAPPESHQTLFVADDDMLVLDNGDVVITLSDSAYLLVTGGTVALMSAKTPDPLVALYPDPDFFQRLRAQLQGQKEGAQREAAARRDWLSWVGWTGPLFASVATEQTELRNLNDLSRRLDLASGRLGTPKSGRSPSKLSPDAFELFFGCFLLPDNRITLCDAEGYWLTTDGRTLDSDKPGAPSRPCPPELVAALKSVLPKLQKEFAADIASDDNDLRQLASDQASLQSDLSQYQSLYAANGYQSDYEVDYGTDEIPVSDAISRTQNDLQQNAQDTAQAHADRDKLAAAIQRLGATLERFGP